MQWEWKGIVRSLVVNLETISASMKCNVQLSNNIIANIVRMSSVRNYICFEEMQCATV